MTPRGHLVVPFLVHRHRFRPAERVERLIPATQGGRSAGRGAHRTFLCCGAVPELIEVEIYRQTATLVLGRRISSVEVVDPFALRHDAVGRSADDVAAAVVGTTVLAIRRQGKLLLVDLGRRAGPEVVLGLRFGMTGRLLVDGRGGIDELLYSSGRDEPAWDRFRVRFAGGGTLSVRDPRRLGTVEIDPDVSMLGVDATELTEGELRRVLAGSSAAVKAKLLDQHAVCGIGNLLADEILWRAGIAPGVAASGIGTARVRRLHAAVHETLAELTERGGSHLGDVMEARRPGGACPHDGAPMRVATIGGRTTWWCPKHQR